MPLRFRRLSKIALGIVLAAGAAWLLVTRCPVVSPFLFRKVIAYMSRHEVHKRVVSGWRGWLFMPADLDNVNAPLAPGNVDRIAQFSRTLAAHGIALFVVPIPNKIDVYPEMLTPVSAPQPVNGSREELLGKLTRAGVRVVDILPALDSVKEEQPVFDHFESHWTCAGIAAAAGVIARAIDSTLKARDILPDTRYTSCDTVFLGKADLAGRLSAPKEFWYQTPVRQIRNENGTSYRDDPKSPILIMGDSFTNHGHWWSAHLGAQIAFFIRHPTRTYSSILANTEGPLMYDRYPRMFPEHGVVVWAFTSRVLQYQMKGDAATKVGKRGTRSARAI